MNEAIPQLLTYDEPTLEAAFATLAEEVRSRRHHRRRSLPPPVARPQTRPSQAHQRSLAQVRAPEANKPLGKRFNQLKQQIEAALEAAGDASRTPAALAAGHRHHPPRHPPHPRHPASPPQDHARDRLRLPPPGLLASASAPRSRPTTTISNPSTSPPATPPATPRTPSSSPASRANARSATACSCAPTPRPSRSAPWSGSRRPLRIVIPGKVHRNDAADATHSPIFHQVEGLCVDTNITFSDLKGTLDHAMKALFGSGVKTRFFPPFSPSPNPAPTCRSAASSAEATAAANASTPAGSSSSAAAWSTPPSSAYRSAPQRPSPPTTPKRSAASPSAWASTASP